MIEVHTLDRLLSNIVKLNSEPNSLHLVICGDMNANTSDNPDCVADESLNHTDLLPDEYCVKRLECSGLKICCRLLLILVLIVPTYCQIIV